MPELPKIILVAGSTGQQGGATAAALLAKGWRVRALIRNPSSPAAGELERSGAELASGGLGARRTRS